MRFNIFVSSFFPQSSHFYEYKMLYNQLFVENIKTFAAVLFWFLLKLILRQNFLANIHALDNECFITNMRVWKRRRLGWVCRLPQNNGNNFDIFHIDSCTCRLIIIQSFFSFYCFPPPRPYIGHIKYLFIKLQG